MGFRGGDEVFGLEEEDLEVGCGGIEMRGRCVAGMLGRRDAGLSEFVARSATDMVCMMQVNDRIIHQYEDYNREVDFIMIKVYVM